VLLMNLCVPLIDMGTQPPVFGHKADRQDKRQDGA
jgi:electron transport complex protein RnfD